MKILAPCLIVRLMTVAALAPETKAADLVMWESGEQVTGSLVPYLTIPSAAPGEVKQFSVAGLPWLGGRRDAQVNRFVSNEGDSVEQLMGVAVKMLVWPAARDTPTGDPDRVLAVPILGLTQTLTCQPLEQTRDCTSTLITVQIPFDEEISQNPGRFNWFYPVAIAVRHGNLESRPLRLHIRWAKPRFLTESTGPTYELIGSKRAVVWGPDGVEQTTTRAGDRVAMAAFGLGMTDPPAPTGIVAEGVFRPRIPFEIDYSFRISGPTPAGQLPTGTITPESIQLIPGLTGQFQIAFRMPQLPAGVADCPHIANGAVGGYNVTLTLRPAWTNGGYFSHTVPLCLQPGESTRQSAPEARKGGRSR